MLYIFGSLPGAGKSTLSRDLARKLRALHLRVDTIEQAICAGGGRVSGPEGYIVAYRIAADNLRLGLPVIADTVNPIEITRCAWREVAAKTGVPFVEIEVLCSDPAEHRRRVETRAADIEGFRLPTW
jgi:predicted kinase